MPDLKASGDRGDTKRRRATFQIPLCFQDAPSIPYFLFVRISVFRVTGFQDLQNHPWHV